MIDNQARLHQSHHFWEVKQALQKYWYNVGAFKPEELAAIGVYSALLAQNYAPETELDHYVFDERYGDERHVGVSFSLSGPFRSVSIGLTRGPEDVVRLWVEIPRPGKQPRVAMEFEVAYDPTTEACRFRKHPGKKHYSEGAVVELLNTKAHNYIGLPHFTVPDPREEDIQQGK